MSCWFSGNLYKKDEERELLLNDQEKINELHDIKTAKCIITGYFIFILLYNLVFLQSGFCCKNQHVNS